MENINVLKNKIDTKVKKFVLLSVVTGGIYTLMWLYLNQPKLTEHMKNEFVARDYPLWLAIVTGFVDLMSNFGTAISDDLTVPDLVAIVLWLASVAMFIFWAFKAKTALQAYALTEFKFELKMKPFYTFIFSIFYIVYCINDMESELQKHNIIYSKKVVE